MILKPVRAWRAFYGPDLWHCGETEEETQGLSDGVLVVVAYELEDYEPGKPYRRILGAADWYFWSGSFVGSLADYKNPASSKVRGYWLSSKPILSRFPDATIKRGIWVSDEKYEATQAVARKAASAPK